MNHPAGQLEYSDPAVTGGLAGFWDWIKPKQAPETLTTQERNARALAIMETQRFLALARGYADRLDAIGKARGPAFVAEPRAHLEAMAAALAPAAAAINQATREAKAAGALRGTPVENAPGLAAWPVLLLVFVVAVAAIVAGFLTRLTYPAVAKANEEARSRSAIIQAWLAKWEQAVAAGTAPPPAPIGLPVPSEAVPWGSFGLAAVLLGAGFLLMGGRRK